MEVIGYEKGKERRIEDINGSSRILERKGEQRNVGERRGETFYNTCIRVWMRI